MVSSMRRANSFISACLTIFAFASGVHASNAQQNQDASDHTTPNIIQNINIEININGPFNTLPQSTPWEFENRPSVQQPDVVSWGGWYFAGALIFIFLSLLLLRPRHYPEPKSVDTKGRRAAIVSGCEPPGRDSDPLRNVTEGVSGVPLLRGKQPATQGSTQGPRPSTPPLWANERSNYVQAGDKFVGMGVTQQVVESPVVDQEGKTHVYQEPPSVARPSSQELPTRTRGSGAPVASSPSPLKASLRGQVRWFILIVAVNYRDITDPENDLKFWIATLWDSTHQRVILKGLAGVKATLKSIEDELTSLYYQAWRTQGISQPNLLIYLTGEGNESGGMYLSDGTSISGGVIEMWLQKLQEEWRLDRLPTVLFDMCRYDTDSAESFVTVGTNMNLIYSCFPGEGALAMSFGRSETLCLLSAFALAFVMTSCDSTYSLHNTNGEGSATNADVLKKYMQARLNQLTNVVNLARRFGSARSGTPQNHIFARTLSRVRDTFWSRDLDLTPQRPDWRQARDLELILDLANMISRMGEARETHRFIINHRYFREANLLLGPTPNYGTTSRNYTRQRQHHRGVNRNVPHVAAKERPPAGVGSVTTSS